MENATKALMIAGAVLIAIMIIGIGMMIYTSASDTINDAMGSVDAMAVESFNSDFLAYEGVQKGSQVKSLITKMMTSNATNAETHPEKVLTLKLDGKEVEESSWNTTRVGIVAGKEYDVLTVTDKKTGLITTIEITEHKASTTE